MQPVLFGLFSDLHANLPGLPERGFGGRSMEDLCRGLDGRANRDLRNYTEMIRKLIAKIEK